MSEKKQYLKGPTKTDWILIKKFLCGFTGEFNKIVKELGVN